jgi:hypothetical protein
MATSIRDFVESAKSYKYATKEQLAQIDQFKKYVNDKGINANDDYTKHFENFKKSDYYSQIQEDEQQPIAPDFPSAGLTTTTSKMPVWGWAIVGIVSLAVVSTVIILGIRAANKNK